MKQNLSFESEQEFQNFFSQLASANFPSFQAVEGAGGDKGFDGLCGEDAFQVFYPTTNRSAKKYKNKIDVDVAKVMLSKSELGLKIKRWIFVVPEDLSIEVVAYLQSKTKESQMECLYWGASKLTELVNKYPYIKDEFPKIFLPPVRQGLKDLEATIADTGRPKVLDGSVEIITDNEFERKKAAITLEHHQKAVSGMGRFGDSSAGFASSIIYQREADEKLADLRNKKQRSDTAYELALADMNDFWDEEVKKIRNDMARRGLSGGIVESEISKIEIKKTRDKERLKLKYGKR